MAILFLSFHADGPYWTDLVHLLAYPPGISYVHPFRYRVERIEPALQTLVQQNRIRTSSTNWEWLLPVRDHIEALWNRGSTRFAEVVIGGRFINEGKDRFLPLRRAQVVHVNPGAVTAFYFRVLEYVDFRHATTLRDLTIPIDVEHGVLAFSRDIPKPVTIERNANTSHANWEHLVRLIGSDKSVSLNEEAQRSIYLRLSSIRKQNGKMAPNRKIQRTSDGPVFGSLLYQGLTYEMPLDYYVPALIGKNTSLGEFTIGINTNHAKVVGQANTLNVVGNYGPATYRFSSMSTTEVAPLTEISPPESKLAQDGTTTIIGTKMRFPYRFKFRLLYWLTSQAIPTLLLFVAMVALALSKLLYDLWTKQKDFSSVVTDWPIVTGTLVSAALATLVIQYLNAKGK